MMNFWAFISEGIIDFGVERTFDVIYWSFLFLGLSGGFLVAADRIRFPDPTSLHVSAIFILANAANVMDLITTLIGVGIAGTWEIEGNILYVVFGNNYIIPLITNKLLMPIYLYLIFHKSRHSLYVFFLCFDLSVRFSQR